MPISKHFWEMEKQDKIRYVWHGVLCCFLFIRRCYLQPRIGTGFRHVVVGGRNRTSKNRDLDAGNCLNIFKSYSHNFIKLIQ